MSFWISWKKCWDFDDLDDLNLNEFYLKSWSWFRDIYKLRFIMNQDFSLIDLLRFSFDYLWVGFSKRNHVFWYSHVLIFHDMIFMQFLVFMKCLSHHLIILLDIPYVMIRIHEIFINLFWCIQIRSFDHVW